MKSNLSLRLLFLFFPILFLSCSDDDSPRPCEVTEISMKVNGELQIFESIGRGIDLRPNGYVLQLNFYRNSEDVEQNLVLRMPYKKTSHNVIDELLFTQFKDGDYIEGDLVNNDFHSKVLINRSTCFYATFSGQLDNDGEQIVITDGKLSWEYDEPFDE